MPFSSCHDLRVNRGMTVDEMAHIIFLKIGKEYKGRILMPLGGFRLDQFTFEILKTQHITTTYALKSLKNEWNMVNMHEVVQEF